MTSEPSVPGGWIRAGFHVDSAETINVLKLTPEIEPIRTFRLTTIDTDEVCNYLLLIVRRTAEESGRHRNVNVTDFEAVPSLVITAGPSGDAGSITMQFRELKRCGK